MKLLRRIFFLFTSTILFSCQPSEAQIEDSLVTAFEDYEENLDSVIKHVEKTYYNRNQFKRLNRLQFVLDKKTYQKRNIFSDSLVSNELRNSAVVYISFEKGSMCLDKHQFDFVRFKLDVKQTAFQYYYVYEFCPQNLEDVDNPNFKSIQLDSNWSIQIEKS